MYKRLRPRPVPATWRFAVIDALAGGDVNGIDNEEITVLFYAVFDANETMVKKLIDAGVDVNVTDKNGETPLFHAVWKKNEIILRALIDAGADVNAIDNEGKTALFHAVRDDNKTMVKTLIDAGADVNVTNNAGQTVLFDAVRDDNETMVKTLIDAGVDVNVTDNEGRTVLFFVEDHDKRSRSGMASTLIEYGDALVEVKDHYGRTPLFYFITKSLSLTKYLLDKGGDLLLKDNCSVLTFFIDECSFGLPGKVSSVKDGLNLLKERKHLKNRIIFKAIVSVAFCKILLCKSGSRYINSLSCFLDLARDYISYHIGKRKAIGRILTMINNPYDNIELIGSGDPYDNIELIESGDACTILTRLYKLGANPNTIDRDGNTALHYAIQLSINGVSQNRVMEICHQLRKCGVSFNIKNQENETALVFCVSILVQRISRADESFPGFKILTSVCKFLVEHGSSVVEKTRSGESVLHFTLKIFKEGFLKHDIEFKKDILVEALKLLQIFVIAYKKKQISVSNEDSNGNTPLHLWAMLDVAKVQDYCSTITGSHTFKDLLIEILNLLLENTAQLNLKNENGETPLHLCRTWTAVELLIDAGANPNDVDSSKRVPLLVAAKNKLFLYNIDSFYPDVLLPPIEFWKSALKKDLDPLTIDKHGESVLSILMESETHNLTTALAEVACKHGSFQRSRDLMLIFLTTICKDKSTNTLWKVDMVKTILNSTEYSVNGNNNEDSPLHFCCRNIMETTKSLSVEQIKENVHWKIAVQLLLHGADGSISDATGQTCLDLAEACPAIKYLLTDPKNYPLLITKWKSVSENYKQRLFKVARHLESKHVDQYWYHKQHLQSGSFGAVFAGIDEKDGREVAIKRIEVIRMQRPEDKREITNLAQLADCEQVVRYLRFLEDGEFSYIILELMEGNLCEYLDKPNTIETRTTLCKDVVMGLQFIHSQKILHRDLKPTNILFKSHPKLCLKIADFGLSRCIESTGSTSVYGSNVGTKYWIAPELLKSPCKHSKSSDVFACGLVLHYILSVKKHPFDPPHCGGMLHETESNLLNGNMEGWDKSLSPEATHLIKKMLESDQTGRPSPDDALTHPLFWSKDKKIGLLKAVGNQQPEFTCPRARRPLPSRTAVENDLEAAFGVIIKFPKWNDPRNVHMPVIYSEMMGRRSYDTSSVVELVRFIRNAYEHVAEISQPKLLLEDYVFLDYFPNLVMEVFKAVTTHRWDKTRDEIIRAMK